MKKLLGDSVKQNKIRNIILFNSDQFTEYEFITDIDFVTLQYVISE